MEASLQSIPLSLRASNCLINSAFCFSIQNTLITKIMLVVGLIIVGTGIYAFAGPGLITPGCFRTSLGAGVLMLALVAYGCQKLESSNWARAKREAIQIKKSHNKSIEEAQLHKPLPKRVSIIEARRELPYDELVRTTFPIEFREIKFHKAEKPFDRDKLMEAMGDHQIVLFPRADASFTWLALAIEHLDSKENLMSRDVLLLSVSLHPGGLSLLQYYADDSDDGASCFDGLVASHNVLVYEGLSKLQFAAMSNWIKKLLKGETCVKINLETGKSSEISLDHYRLRKLSE